MKRIARSFAFVVVFSFLAGCLPSHQGTLDARRLVPPTESGPVVAQHLQSRYDELVTACSPSSTPAVLCSGVLMRGTRWATGYHSWIPNPSSSAGGVSFSWLRQDSNFGATAYPNGFVVYPHYFSDDPYFYQLTVNCGYVVNASTGSLADKCRTPCHRQGVITAEQWLAKYASGHGCAFKIAPADAAPDPAFAWMQLVKVRAARRLFTLNEIMIAPWPQSTHANMPLEAFFYREGNTAARTDAGKDQKDFLTTAGRWVPVIAWTPATAIGGRAMFAYRDADQAIRP